MSAETLSSLIFIGMLALAYFIPAIVAAKRNHRNDLAIFMLNLFLGWTMLGWIAALVWACTNDVEGHAHV